MPLRLILRQITKHWVRALLTVASLAVAMLLLCMLRSLVTTLRSGVEAASSQRLIVQSAVSLFVNLPESYETKIRGVDGVREVTKFQWFGGVYQDPSNFFGQFGVDPASFLEVYPEVQVIDGSSEPFLLRQDVCLIGEELAQRFDWEVGDSVPLIGTIFPMNDGSAWTFEVVGIYRSEKNNVDNQTLYFPFEYLRQALESGAASGPPGAGVYVIDLDAGSASQPVMSKVDALFDGGPQRVQTTTEAEFQAQFVSMVGNVPMFVSLIGGGVLAAIILAVINTMLMAGREQTRDAGVMKALGFSNGVVGATFVLQSLLICAIGGGLGIGLAKLFEPGMRKVLGVNFPGFAIQQGTILWAVGLTVVLGLVAGLVPAMRAARLNPVQALREL